jgi:hypothetical protein
MVVRDDEIEAETAGGFRFGESAHACVNGDDEADSFGVGGFEDAGLEAVPLEEAMGDMKTGLAPEHFDGGLKQDNCGCAVHVVVAIEEDRFPAAYGQFKTLDGGRHSQHEEGIVKLVERGVEKGVGLNGGGDSTGEKQFGEDQGQAGCLSQTRGLFRMLLGYQPALMWTLAG